MSESKAAPSCRLCGEDPSRQTIKGEHVYGGKPGQHFWKCGSCSGIYLFPPLTEEEEHRFYAKEFEKFMSDRAGADMNWTGPEEHIRTNQREVARRMPVLEPFLKPGMRVLEVGCSSGFMLYALREKGCKVHGIDPSGGFIDFVRSKRVPIYQSLEALKKAESAPFDLIIHYYVFEHVPDPDGFLRSYMELLAPGGAMVFEAPCATDPLVELYAVPAFDRFYWSVAHHWYFNRESLSFVLDRVGVRYEILPEQRYDLSNHIVWMKDGKPGGMSRYASVFGEDLDRLYKDKLKESWLCDTLLCIIRK